MHMANSSAQITPVSVKFTSHHGTMVLTAISQWMYKHVPLQMQQGWTWCLVSHPAMARCRLQLALLIPQDPWIHSLLQENPTVMCFLSEKGVWEKGNKSNYLAPAFIFLSSASRQALIPWCQASDSKWDMITKVKWCFAEMVPEWAGWGFVYTDLVFCSKS